MYSSYTSSNSRFSLHWECFRLFVFYIFLLEGFWHIDCYDYTKKHVAAWNSRQAILYCFCEMLFVNNIPFCSSPIPSPFHTSINYICYNYKFNLHYALDGEIVPLNTYYLETYTAIKTHILAFKTQALWFKAGTNRIFSCTTALITIDIYRYATV